MAAAENPSREVENTWRGYLELVFMPQCQTVVEGASSDLVLSGVVITRLQLYTDTHGKI